MQLNLYSAPPTQPPTLPYFKFLGTLELESNGLYGNRTGTEPEFLLLSARYSLLFAL